MYSIFELILFIVLMSWCVCFCPLSTYYFLIYFHNNLWRCWCALAPIFSLHITIIVCEVVGAVLLSILHLFFLLVISINYEAVGAFVAVHFAPVFNSYISIFFTSFHFIIFYYFSSLLTTLIMPMIILQ